MRTNSTMMFPYCARIPLGSMLLVLVGACEGGSQDGSGPAVGGGANEIATTTGGASSQSHSDVTSSGGISASKGGVGATEAGGSLSSEGGESALGGASSSSWAGASASTGGAIFGTVTGMSTGVCETVIPWTTGTSVVINDGDLVVDGSTVYQYTTASSACSDPMTYLVADCQPSAAAGWCASCWSLTALDCSSVLGLGGTGS